MSTGDGIIGLSCHRMLAKREYSILYPSLGARVSHNTLVSHGLDPDGLVLENRDRFIVLVLYTYLNEYLYYGIGEVPQNLYKSTTF